MARHNELGKQGELLAVEYLQKQAYNIKRTNVRVGRDEIDIIAEKDDELIFVEVKTRESDYLGRPCASVTLAKQKRIIRAANRYLIDNDLDNEVRFDIIGIVINQKTKTINHLPAAFNPSWM